MRKITEKEALELVKNNYIKIIIKDCKSQKKFDKFLESMLSSSKNNYKVEVIEACEILESVDLNKMEESVNQESSPIEVVAAYTNELDMGTDIDPDKLKECFDILYKEALLLEKEGV